MKYYRYPFFFILTVILLMSTGTSYSGELSSTNNRIMIDAIDGGGGTGSSQNYSIYHSIGQSTAIGDSSSSNYYNYAGYWHAFKRINDRFAVPAEQFIITGSGYNLPVLPFRASLALDVKESDLPGSRLRYSYSRSRLSFASTSIDSATVSGNTAIISGTGKVNGAIDYTFTATVSDNNPDELGIEIFRPEIEGGSIFHSAASQAVIRGNFKIETE